MADIEIVYGNLKIFVADIILTQLISFAIGIVVASIGIYKFFYLHKSRLEEIEHQTRLESAKLHLEINSRFDSEKYKDLEERLSKHMEEKITFETGLPDSKKRKNLYDYLNEIELICQFHEDEILTTTQFYELMGYTIMGLVNVKPILEMIDNERTRKDGFPDFMDNFQKTYPILLDHQTKKWNKLKPESIMTLAKD